MRKLLLIVMVLTAIAFGTSAAAQGVTLSGQVGNYTYVDLGLPSGTKWATCNVGAKKSTEYGDCFAWGEIEAKVNYSRETYKRFKDHIMNKYYSNSDCDSLTTLLAEDDAATVNWGEGWRMPTETEQNELRNGCDWEWTNNFDGSGVEGRIGTSKTNGNIIFLPAAGYRDGTKVYAAGYYGSYWSSSPSISSTHALGFHFKHDFIAWFETHRYVGRSVRAVVK